MRAIRRVLEGRRHYGSNSRPMANRIAGTQGWVENVVVKKNDGGGRALANERGGRHFWPVKFPVKHLMLTCGPQSGDL